MTMTIPPLFQRRKTALRRAQRRLLARRNAPCPEVQNGIFDRYRFPVLTAAHVPLEWRFDLDPRSNPYLMERLGVNAVFNAGAIDWHGGVCLAARLEGWDRKSFFAIAESRSGVDGFRFWEEPLALPETGEPDDNVYDMRLTRHADGWIYGVFCSERKDPAAPPGDTSRALARAGIARTHDLKTWERLPDLQTASPQQRNVVLHPEFVDGKYAFYTRPMDGFIDVGSGGGIGWGLCADITRPVLVSETIIDEKRYHTVKESKNGAGAPPVKTPAGWLHIAHGVRNTAAGLRYVLYALLCDLDQPWRVIRRPGGYLMAPEGEERLGDVSNVLFCNGVVARPGGQVLIYYGASDTRTHVAATTIDRLLDYVTNTPEDGLRTAACVRQRLDLIEKNRACSSC